MKFKIGDMVKYIGSWGFYEPYESLVVIDIDDFNEDPILPYYVTNREGDTTWLKEDDLEFIENTKDEKGNNNMKVFGSLNRNKTLGALYPGNYFKFEGATLKGYYGIVCDYTENVGHYMENGEKIVNKVPCFIFSDNIPYPTFSFEDASTEIKELSGKVIFEED